MTSPSRGVAPSADPSGTGQNSGVDPIEPLAGIYGFLPPGSSVLVHDGPMVVGGTHQGQGQVWLSLDADLRLVWETDAHAVLGDTNLSLDRPELGWVEVPATVYRSTGAGEIAEANLGETSVLSRVVTHWINLPIILPAAPLKSADLVWAGRWSCEGGGWTLTLDQRPDHQSCVEAMRGTRKFTITHVGELRRSDNAPFTADQAADTLRAFQLALSFAVGGWVAPALPVGLDSTGRRVWEQWAAWRCDPFHGHLQWWDTHTGADLSAMVGQYLSAWTTPGARDVVRHLAHHAISANHMDVTLEARIMLAQAGLEYLAWITHVVEGGRSRAEHKALQAHEVLRELTTAAKIPNAIPPELDALPGLLTEEDADGPRVVTWLRNRLVHPKDAGEPYQLAHTVDHAWLLSMHYLDLLLLHRLGYQGAYLKRFPPGGWAHGSQPVPWAST